MPNKRRSSGQRAVPKLFRCTGYGNCDMVFTRSEHLARHERKHTGEKPYKCVVPGCGRMFSRFDNMMQHTQTHEKNKKMVPSSTPSAVEKMTTSPTTAAAHGHNIRAPTMTPIKTEPWFEQQQQRNQSIPDLVMATSSGVPPLEHSSMINSRTLPLPTRRASFSAYNNDVAAAAAAYPNYRSPYPYPYCTDNGFYSNNIPRNRSSWPVKREPYQHYYQTQQVSQQSYYNARNDDYYNTIRRRSSTSTISSDSTTLISPTTYQYPQDPQIVRRRISIDDLRLPIENLRNIQLDEEKAYYKYYSNNISNNNNNNTVDITPDEYEALEGFSKFHSSPVIARDSPSPTELTPSPVLRNQSPNIAAQVCAMRQRVMTLNESFQRR